MQKITCFVGKTAVTHLLTIILNSNSTCAKYLENDCIPSFCSVVHVLVPKVEDRITVVLNVLQLTLVL